MDRIKHRFFLLIFVVCKLTIFAQKNNDAGLWATFTVQHAISKKINLVVDQEFRLKENYQRINLFYTNAGLDYKLNKFIKISPSYRAIQKRRLNETFSYRHRLMLDVAAKKKFQQFTFSERVRYQCEVQDFNTSRKGKLIEQFLRFRTDLKYNINKRVTPFISCELRCQIRASRGDGRLYDKGFHRVRNIIGTDVIINKKNTLSVYYLAQYEFNISTPESIYILGVAYALTL